MKKLKLDRSVGPVTHFFAGGTGEAGKYLRHFLSKGIEQYVEHGNRIETDDVSLPVVESEVVVTTRDATATTAPPNSDVSP